MDALTPLNSTTEDAPVAVNVPPLPVLGGGIGTSPAVLQQEWVGERRTFPIVFKPGRQSMSDHISEYRTGQIIFDTEGLTITGKAVLPAQTQTPIIVVLVLLVRLGALIAYFLMEYAFRRDRTDRLLWADVLAVLTDSPSERVCIIYSLPTKPKTKYALGLKMEGGYMDDFLRSIRPYISDRIIERKIGPATPTVVWVVLGGITAAFIAFFIWGILNP